MLATCQELSAYNQVRRLAESKRRTRNIGLRPHIVLKRLLRIRKKKVKKNGDY
jgi:hypothetical protein